MKMFTLHEATTRTTQTIGRKGNIKLFFKVTFLLLCIII